MKYLFFLIILLIVNILFYVYYYFFYKDMSKDHVFSLLVSSCLSFLIFLIINLIIKLNTVHSLFLSLIITIIVFFLDLYKVLFKNKKSLFLKKRNFNNKFERIVKISMLVLVIIYLVVTFFNSKLFYIAYPLEYDTFNVAKNPYALLFEGLQDGHLYLKILPDDTLLSLKEPYGNRQNVTYLWDFCFYNEKYYVYFGIGPVILFYYPIYFLSFAKYIPTYIFMNYFCLILASGYSILALYRFYKHFCKKFNLYLFVLMVLILFFGGGYLLLCLAEPMYNTPILVATTFMFIMFYYCIKGIEENNKISFALMAFSFVVILASRPNLAFSVLVLLPLLFTYLLNKDFLKKIKIFIPCFTVLIFGVSLICLYNYLRFDNIFDFGANYQLTVSDISKNKLRISNIWPTLYYYFMQKPVFNNNYPYISIALKNIKEYNLTYYVYTYPTIGLLTIPINICMFLGIINFKDKKYLIMNIIFILNVFILAFFDFSLAGVHLRYLMDILSMTVFISILNLLVINDKINNDKLRLLYFIIVLIIVVFSLIMFISLVDNFSYNIDDLIKNFTAERI